MNTKMNGNNRTSQLTYKLQSINSSNMHQLGDQLIMRFANRR